MRRRPPRTPRTYTPLPYTTLFRSDHEMPALRFGRQARAQVVEQEIGIARIQCVEPAAVEFGERGLRLQRPAYRARSAVRVDEAERVDRVVAAVGEAGRDRARAHQRTERARFRVRGHEDRKSTRLNSSH